MLGRVLKLYSEILSLPFDEKISCLPQSFPTEAASQPELGRSAFSCASKSSAEFG
jgi:hypothetical protein